MNSLVEEKLKQLVHSPGVYIMKNDKGKIIYVGKAISLKNRVSQYFRQSHNHSPKVKAMVSHVEDFETIICGSEMEALILECNLIKKHRPKYNISLKDDKTYPYVKVTMAEDFPRVYITRRVVRDGSKYFGPYTNVSALHDSLKLLKKLFPLRSCRRLDADRPCLEHHIGRCLAPCAGKVSAADYGAMIRTVLLFLEGRTDMVDNDLESRMNEAADNLEFEAAARLRDQLLAVRAISEKQRIVSGTDDQDAIGMARSGLGACVQVFYIRNGKMVGRNHFLLSGSDDEADENLLQAFLQQYYSEASFVPKEILLPIEIPDMELLGSWLSGLKGQKAEIICPKRGTKKDIVDMAVENAKKSLSDEADRIKLANEQTIGAVADLGRYLGLVKPPKRMECFDISHIQGSETVASMVVFEDGVPKKSDYRRFKIRSAEGKPDDFKSMREVTMRRYGKPDAEMPDLIIIDGGKGQLSSALEIIRGAGHCSVAVVGLAKRFEEVYREGESDPVILPRGSQALYLIQRIRDEAHRFAITFHRQLRNKRNLVSVLDHIDGIGPKRRKLLLEHFSNIDKIKEASVAEMASLDGMTTPAAEAVFNFFNLICQKSSTS